MTIDPVRLWMCLCITLVTMATSHVTADQPASPQRSMSKLDVIDYFTHYQYMGNKNPDPRISSLTDPAEQLRQACFTFQRNWNLNVTGELTDEMLELMSQPRCSVPDINIMEETRRRKKRYISFSKWNHTNITYKISMFPRDWDLTQEEVATSIQQAFDVWAKVSSLTFTRLGHYDKVDIDIQFGSYHHGDYYPFDGPNGYLAHAFFPPIGNTHFDDSETWTLTANNYNFFVVAVHEFGHALGLGHNTFVNSAIMYPNYQYKKNLTLDYDDVRGIQSLYGPPDTRRRTPRPPQPDPTIPPTTPKPQPTKRTEPNQPTPQRPKVTIGPTRAPVDGDTPDSRLGLRVVCKDPKIEAMMYVEDPNDPSITGTYGFQGAYYFKIGDSGYIPAGYPRKIRDDWPGIPDNIDAALHWSDDPPKNYIFKGNDYWSLEGMNVLPGYPKKIDEKWGLPADLSAAFVWNRNGKTYFVKGNKYYRFSRNYGLDRGYPREVDRNWVGIPQDVDAAFQWDNMQTYFFKGNQYWRFQDDIMMVAPQYPRMISRTWFRCQRVNRDSNIYSQDNSTDLMLIDIEGGNHGERLSVHIGTIPLLTLSLLLACLTFH